MACTITAVLALAVPPAHAAGGAVRAARGIELSGERTFVRTDLRVTNTAKSIDLGVYFGLGDGESMHTVGVRLIQKDSDQRSRMLKAYAFGEFKNLRGLNCEIGGFTECDRNGFNWVVGRDYRVILDRGNHTDNGWLWSLKIVDRSNGNATELLSFRAPDRELNRTANLAFLDLAPANCSNINTAAGVVTKPRRQDGTAYGWGAKESFKEGCDNATVTAPVVDGKLRLKIAQ